MFFFIDKYRRGKNFFLQGTPFKMEFFLIPQCIVFALKCRIEKEMIKSIISFRWTVMLIMVLSGPYTIYIIHILNQGTYIRW